VSVRKDEIHVATLRELAEAHVEIARLTKALDEREADMHMRIRAGYDKTVADAWRAEVAKRDAEIADLRALVESQRRDYLDVCDAIAPETSGQADAAAKVRAALGEVHRAARALEAATARLRVARAAKAALSSPRPRPAAKSPPKTASPNPKARAASPRKRPSPPQMTARPRT